MKKVLIINILLMVSVLSMAQQTPTKKPTPSPEAAFTQQFGESEIQVAYARPSAKGRKFLVDLCLLIAFGAQAQPNVPFSP